MIRYARAPSKGLRALFLPGRMLCGLLDQRTAVGLPLGLDVQFREGDCVTVYCGLTRLLHLELRAGVVHIRAHRTYSTQECGRGLFGARFQDASDIVEEVKRYLRAVQVRPSHVRAEGAVQAEWAVVREPWLPFDREAVLGYETKVAQAKARAAAAVSDARKAVVETAKRDARAWALLPSRKVNAELDQLAVDGHGRLVLIEMKHGRASGASVYYSPLQLLQYVHEWTRAFAAVRGDLEALIEARRAVGLLPAQTPKLNGDLLPVIAFGKDLPSTEVRRRFDQIHAIANRYLPVGVAPIEVWRMTEGGVPDRIG